MPLPLPSPDVPLDWLRPAWWSPATLASFEWAHRSLLYFIPALPLLWLLRVVLALRTRPRLEMAFFPDQARWRWIGLLRFIPDTVLTIAMALIMIALARPQQTTHLVEQSSQGIDIMLVLDTSASMQLRDLEPNRLEAAKAVAREFIRGRFHDRIGLVVFAGEAYSLAPLTTDYDLLIQQLSTVKLGLIPADGTAIGAALGVAVNRLRDSPTRSRVCILLSDGENTAGQLAPETAARLAHAFSIRLYTIGLGADGVVAFDTDTTTGQTRFVDTRLDETTMRQLAGLADGRFFRATNEAALNTIFRDIDRLEKGEIRETRFRDTRDFYPVYLRWAVVLFVTWIALRSSFLSSALED